MFKNFNLVPRLKLFAQVSDLQLGSAGVAGLQILNLLGVFLALSLLYYNFWKKNAAGKAGELNMRVRWKKMLDHCLATYTLAYGWRAGNLN